MILNPIKAGLGSFIFYNNKAWQVSGTSWNDRMNPAFFQHYQQSINFSVCEFHFRPVMNLNHNKLSMQGVSLRVQPFSVRGEIFVFSHWWWNHTSLNWELLKVISQLYPHWDVTARSVVRSVVRLWTLNF